MSKISLPKLRKIIHEELQSANLSERVDHASLKSVVTCAAEMLAAIDEFRENATTSMISAVTPHLDSLDKILEDMASTPGSYVVKPKAEPQKVTLKPVKSWK